jgi:hypothetical protein
MGLNKYKPLLWFLSIKTPSIMTIWGKYGHTYAFYFGPFLYKDNSGEKSKRYICKNSYKTPLFRKNMSEEQKKGYSYFGFKKI